MAAIGKQIKEKVNEKLYVKVRFEDNKAYNYFSDYDVMQGDSVEVQGSYEGQRGVVETVSYAQLTETAFSKTLSVKKAFYGEAHISKGTTDGYVHVTIDGGISIIGYEGKINAKKLVIPATLDGKPVKCIETNAFANLAKHEVIEIVFPDSIETIKKDAFPVSYLANIVFPANLKTIEKDSLKIHSFSEPVRIPDHVTNIEVILETENGIREFDVSENNECYKLIDGILYNKKVTELIHVPSKLEISTVNVQAGVKKIYKWAFAKNVNLKEVVMPDTITSIGEDAFCKCTSLEKVKLSNKLTKLEDSTFAETGIVEVEIPEGVKEIGKWAFRSAEKLTRVIIPSSVKKIGACCFADCASLKEVVLDSFPSEIGETVFKHCFSLEQITVANRNKLIDRLLFVEDGIRKNWAKEWEGESAGFYDSESKELVDMFVRMRLNPSHIEETIWADAAAAGYILNEYAPDSLKRIYPDAEKEEIVKYVAKRKKQIMTEFADEYPCVTAYFKKNKDYVLTDDEISAISSKVIPDSHIGFTGEVDGFVVTEGKLVAYKGPAVEKLVIPEGVEVITTGAFYGNSSVSKVKEIVLPTTLKKVESCAFTFEPSIFFGLGCVCDTTRCEHRMSGVCSAMIGKHFPGRIDKIVFNSTVDELETCAFNMRPKECVFINCQLPRIMRENSGLEYSTFSEELLWTNQPLGGLGYIGAVDIEVKNGDEYYYGNSSGYLAKNHFSDKTLAYLYVYQSGKHYEKLFKERMTGDPDSYVSEMISAIKKLGATANQLEKVAAYIEANSDSVSDTNKKMMDGIACPGE